MSGIVQHTYLDLPGPALTVSTELYTSIMLELDSQCQRYMHTIAPVCSIDIPSREVNPHPFTLF